MAHPSKRKGDRHELATMATLTALLDGTGLTVERTHDGYERDGGDLHILTPDRVVLFVVQCKDVIVKDWRFPEWLRDLAAQRAVAHAGRGFLSVKRPRVLDAATAYAVCDVAAMAALVRELYQLRALDAENLRLREQAGEMAEEIERLRAAVDAPRSISSESIMNGDGAVRYPWRRPDRDPVSP